MCNFEYHQGDLLWLRWSQRRGYFWIIPELQWGCHPQLLLLNVLFVWIMPLQVHWKLVLPRYIHHYSPIEMGWIIRWTWVMPMKSYMFQMGFCGTNSIHLGRRLSVQAQAGCLKKLTEDRVEGGEPTDVSTPGEAQSASGESTWVPVQWQVTPLRWAAVKYSFVNKCGQSWKMCW